MSALPPPAPYGALCVSAVLSALSYCPPDDIAAAVAPTCPPAQVGRVSAIVGCGARPLGGDAAYAWAPSGGGGTCYVAFRGTDSLRDVAMDMDVHLTEVPEAGFSLHSGFYGVYRSVESELFQLIGDGRFERIVLVGHSHGGAIAQIAAAMAVVKQRCPAASVRCHSFGSPRVGDNAWSKWFDTHGVGHWQVFLEDDIVPLQPTLRCYRHTRGNGIRIAPPRPPRPVSAVACDGEVPWWRRMATSLLALLDLHRVCEDHSTARYVELLSGLCPPPPP